MSTCQICIENINKINKPIQCPSCSEVCCKKCFVTYINQSGCEPFCMFCTKKPISMEFIRKELPNSTVVSYEKYRLQMFLQTEKSLLPITQLQINRVKIINTIKLLQYQLREVNILRRLIKEKIHNNYANIFNEMEQKFYDLLYIIENSNEDISIIEFNRNKEIELFAHHHNNLVLERNNLYTEKTAELTDKKQKLVFELENLTIQLNTDKVEKCYNNTCRGYISTQTNICCACNNLFCSDCNEIKNDDHVCDKDTVETILNIKKDSKPCPKCGVYINKIDGCDQIFCVVPTCQAVFSFSTGLLEKGTIHNPEYYRFLRDRNNGIIPENECTILPSRNDFHNLRKQFQLEKLKFIDNFYDQTYKIGYNIQFLQREFDLEILRKEYLNNIITEAQWSKKLQSYLKKKDRNNEILLILNTVYRIFVNYFHAIVNGHTTIDYIIDNSCRLIHYANNEMVTLNKTFKSVDTKYFLTPMDI